MILHYISIFQEIFLRIPKITIIFLIMFLLSTIIMFTMMLVILLDNFYRPTVAQYPYSIIFDRIIPIILLILPALFVFVFTKNIETISLQLRFIIIFVVHLFVIIPVFHYWSKLRSWNAERDSVQAYITLDNPIIYKQIAIAIMYPAIWGIYFTLVRYLRLGITINIFTFISNANLDWLTIFLWLLPFYTIWLKMVLWKLLDFRVWLWFEISKLLYVLHIYFLQYDSYFKLFEKLHKLAFIWGTYISLNPHVYPVKDTYSKVRHLLRTLYFKPYLISLFMGFFILLELLITKGTLYYSIYILFTYPLIYIIGWFLSYLYTMSWVTDVCRADYFKRNWENPRYPFEFWVFFAEPSERYNFSWNYSSEEREKINKEASKYFEKNYSFVPTLALRIKNRAWCMRLKGAYRTYNGIRWNNN